MSACRHKGSTRCCLFLSIMTLLQLKCIVSEDGIIMLKIFYTSFDLLVLLTEGKPLFIIALGLVKINFNYLFTRFVLYC